MSSRVSWCFLLKLPIHGTHRVLETSTVLRDDLLDIIFVTKFVSRIVICKSYMKVHKFIII